MSSSQNKISKTLIDELCRDTQVECRSIKDAAIREAAAIVAGAFASARVQGREAIAAMRQEARRRLRLAEAQRQTRERAEQQARRAASLRLARPMLEGAMLRRWREPGTRHLWISAAARCATGRLRPGPWTVEHPAEFDEADRQVLIDDLRVGPRLTFRLNAATAAGIRVLADGAVLDASLAALISDGPMIEAMLLAELSQAADEWRRPGGAP